MLESFPFHCGVGSLKLRRPKKKQTDFSTVNLAQGLWNPYSALSSVVEHILHTDGVGVQKTPQTRHLSPTGPEIALKTGLFEISELRIFLPLLAQGL